MCAALAACADDPAAARIVAPETLSSPNAAVGDVILVTTASGGTEPGSLRWAASQATGGEIIRFAPEIRNEIIRLTGPVVAQNHITIEGPRDGSIDVSGELQTRVLELNAGGTLRKFTAFTKVAFTLDPDVALDPATGLAVVTGTVTCSETQAFTVSVKLGQNELGGDASAVACGTGSASVDCTTTPQRWTVAVAPSVGVFHPGVGAASARTDNAPKWVAPATINSAVRLAKSQK
jgi:hypothetical protein